jgi:hypothetical protein
LGRGGQRITLIPAKSVIVVFTGGEFEPADIGKFIGESIKSNQRRPENPARHTRLAEAIGAAARPPSAPATSMAKTISGRKYLLEANPLGLKTFSFTFSAQKEAVAHLESIDSGVEERLLGLDGIPRVSPGGRFGLPVALQGRWESNSTIVFDYDEVANINSYRFRLTFLHDDVSIELSEKTGLVDAKFHGKSVEN